MFSGNVKFSNKKANGKKKKTTKAVVRRGQKSSAEPCDRVVVGQVVLCKMKGFCECTAIVTGLEGNQIAIRFFGDNTTHKAALCNFYSFEKSHRTIIENIRPKKTGLYERAVLEAEYALGIPREMSIIARD